LLEPYNLLVLDEPTNHLDIRSKDVLKRALLSFEGTVVLVSHDRDFLSGLTEKMFEFRNGNVREHLCTMDEFMDKIKLNRLNEMNAKMPFSKPKPTEEKGLANAIEKQEKEHELKQLKSAITKCEKEIEQLENDIKDFDSKLANPEIYEKIMNDKSAFEKYNSSKKQLEEEMKKWENLQSQL
jgi:ATP-binding cassette subfamily F protein 3